MEVVATTTRPWAPTDTAIHQQQYEFRQQHRVLHRSEEIAIVRHEVRIQEVAIRRANASDAQNVDVEAAEGAEEVIVGRRQLRRPGELDRREFQHQQLHVAETAAEVADQEAQRQAENLQHDRLRDGTCWHHREGHITEIHEDPVESHRGAGGRQGDSARGGRAADHHARLLQGNPPAVEGNFARRTAGR